MTIPELDAAGRMTGLLYILAADRQPVPCSDILAWGIWMAEHSEMCVVAQEELSPGIRVSTVFLGVDHGLISDASPILFETMWFTDYGGQGQQRYCTWDEAVAGHAEVVAAVVERVG